MIVKDCLHIMGEHLYSPLWPDGEENPSSFWLWSGLPVVGLLGVDSPCEVGDFPPFVSWVSASSRSVYDAKRAVTQVPGTILGLLIQQRRLEKESCSFFRAILLFPFAGKHSPVIPGCQWGEAGSVSGDSFAGVLYVAGPWP